MTDSNAGFLRMQHSVAAAFLAAALLSGCATEVVEPPAERLSKVTGVSPVKELSVCLLVVEASYTVNALGERSYPMSEAKRQWDEPSALLAALRTDFRSAQRVADASQVQDKDCDLLATARVDFRTSGQRNEYDVYTLHLAFSDRKQAPIDALKVEGKSMDFEDFGYGLNGGDTFARARERGMRFLAIAFREAVALTAFAARGPQEAEARFQEEAARYLQLSRKPDLPEEARRFKVQAEIAARENRFADAAALYMKALDIAPWWPGGRFNRAVLLGEIKSYGSAVREMKRYLLLVPDAPDGRAARDKIYEWEVNAR